MDWYFEEGSKYCQCRDLQVRGSVRPSGQVREVATDKRDRMSGNSHGKTGTIAVTTTDIHLARRGDGNLYLDRNGVRNFTSGQDEYLVRLKGTR
jgi:hypothetical protein